MTINRNKNSNRFCGPNALAALTGRHVDDTAHALRIVTKRKAIKGVFNRHMVAALELLGYRATLVPVQRPLTAVMVHRTKAARTAQAFPTLTQVLRGALKGRGAAPYLVNTTGHYVVIRGRMLFDNKHPEGIRLTECPYRRKRVKAIYAVEAGVPATPLPKPVTGTQFARAVERLGCTTDGGCVDAPGHHRFDRNGTHCLSITGTYEEMLAQLVEERIVACPGDCECRAE
jgi:hypothetical protein